VIDEGNLEKRAKGAQPTGVPVENLKKEKSIKRILHRLARKFVTQRSF
jgi:hypothetical protein